NPKPHHFKPFEYFDHTPSASGRFLFLFDNNRAESIPLALPPPNPFPLRISFIHSRLATLSIPLFHKHKSNRGVLCGREMQLSPASVRALASEPRKISRGRCNLWASSQQLESRQLRRSVVFRIARDQLLLRPFHCPIARVTLPFV